MKTNLYGIKNLNDMTRIHDKEVNKISRCKLLHDVINPPKLTKYLNSHYSPIIHEFMNTRIGIEKFNNFQILLCDGCSYALVMGSLVEKLNHEKDDVMQWHTQDENITTSIEIKVDFTLLALSVTNIMT